MSDDIISNTSDGFFKNLGEYAHNLKCVSGIYNISLGKHNDVTKAPLLIPPDIWAGDSARGHDILQGLYSFSGQSFHSINVLWEPADYNDGWLTAMHGFDMLRDLKSTGGDRARHHARYLIADWLDNYNRWHPLAWRTDIIARRIVHWLSCYSVFCASAEEEFSCSVLESLMRQSKHLSRHVKGGDLLYSAKSLLYSGMALGQEAWCQQALVLLKQEIQSDILTDGGHCSRSPENHLIFLQNLLDIRSALNIARFPLPDILQHAIKKMALVLRALRHNDGALPLFHGGGISSGSLCDMVLGQSGAGGRPLKSLGAMGYDRLTQGRTTILVDTGSVVDTQKHASLLAFEFSTGKDRIVVNCGAWASHSSWQEALQSTPAHATVTVENSNSFYRASGVQKIEKATVQKTREEKKGIISLNASHDGYVRRFGVTHNRSFILKNAGRVLEGVDSISGINGVNFAIRFHLHPSISASIIRNGDGILLRTQSGQGWFFSSSYGRFALEESVYVNNPHCDAPRRSQQIVVHATSTEPVIDICWQFERV